MEWYLIDSTTGKILQADGSWGAGAHQFTIPNSPAWTVYELEFDSESTGTYSLRFDVNSAASSSFYLDACKIREKL